jgi:hypothetical protein
VKLLPAESHVVNTALGRRAEGSEPVASLRGFKRQKPPQFRGF